MEKHIDILSLFFYWVALSQGHAGGSSSYIPDASPLSVIDANIFFLFVVCLLTFLMAQSSSSLL